MSHDTHNHGGSSSSSAISVSSSNDEISIHSSISGDSQLDDHRMQSSNLPIRTDSKLASTNELLPASAAAAAARRTSAASMNASKSNSGLMMTDILPTSQTSGKNTRRTKRTNSHSSFSPPRPLHPMSEKPSSVNINENLASRDLLSKMVVGDDGDDYDEYAVKFNDRYKSSNVQNLSFASNMNTPTPLNMNTEGVAETGSKKRSKSFSDQVKSFIRPKEDSVTAGGILISTNGGGDDLGSVKSEAMSMRSFDATGNSNMNMRRQGTQVQYLDNPIVKVMSRASSTKSGRSRRRLSNDIDSDMDSHASRESQETEEDVCFPMLPEHVRIRGIDFDEIEEFIVEQREENRRISEREKSLKMGTTSMTTSAEKVSSAALKYIPRNANQKSNESSSVENNIGSTDGKNKVVNPGHDVDISMMQEGNGNMNYYGSSGGENGTFSEKEKDEEYELEEDEDEDGDGEPENVTFHPQGNVHEFEEEEEEEEDELPTRFSFFSSEMEETIHAADIPSLVVPGQAFKTLFEPKESIWWLDCTCPTDNEMKMLAKAFSIHPLTAEDIRMQETREKVELFKSYYFVSFHTFETDSESEDFLEPINVYIVVFNSGILTFHFSPIVNPANVRRRVRQLRDYVNVSADWLCYAMIDDITDGFAPIIQSIEYEADSIEDSVFLSQDNDFGSMLLKIGESRRKVMTLMRLLQGKADVIKMFAKRCHEEAAAAHRAKKEDIIMEGYHNSNNQNQPEDIDSRSNSRQQQPPYEQQHSLSQAKPSADIALYLGDIQDHIITMFQSLLSYEKIFSRSHSNYLAQLQVESFYSNIQVTDMLSKVTLLGTILVPMNLITGLFGMNVKVPGNDQKSYGWFGGIIGVIFSIILLSLVGASYYLKYVEQTAGRQTLTSGLSMKNFRIGRKKNNSTGGGTRRADAVSLPTRFTKYGDW